jgi:isopentenyl-diphosphate delta-isomerase
MLSTESLGDISGRKDSHLDLSRSPDSQTGREPFADWRLPYVALPEIDFQDVTAETEFLGFILSQPLIISSMTGGTEHGKKINENLAIAAQETQIALGVGSQRIAFRSSDAEEMFRKVRRDAPDACIIANLGAVQLNYELTIDDYRRAVSLVKANALYLHLNASQEALQPGGNTNFKGLTEKIIKLIQVVDVPVFIKEVGNGIDVQTAQAMLEAGVAGIDVAGQGGTSFDQIEATRRGQPELAKWFENEGIPTEEAVQTIAPLMDGRVLIASGGIRNPAMGLKAHARPFGADLVATTRPFLDEAMVSPEAVIQSIKRWEFGFRYGMFRAGKRTWEEAADVDLKMVG